MKSSRNYPFLNQYVFNYIFCFILVLTLFFTYNVNAQQEKQHNSTRIYGYVENINGAPLAFATVKLLAVSDTTLVKGAGADAKGFFEFFNVPYGTYFISFTSISSKPLFTNKFSIDSITNTVNLSKIIVKEKVITMEEVLISSKKPLLEMKRDKLVVNIDNSYLATGNTITEVLPSLPGVSTNTNGILLNGKAALILIDGKGELDSKGIKELISNIGADQVEAIEIISNPSPKYDANVQGIINIKLKKERNFSSAHILVQSQLAPVKGISGIDYSRFSPGFNLNLGSGKLSTSTNFNFVGRSSFEEIQENIRIEGVQLVSKGTEHVEKENYISYRSDIQYNINEEKNHLMGITVSGFYNFSHRGKFNSKIHYQDPLLGKIDSSLYSKIHSKSKGINHNNVTAYYSRKFNNGKQHLDIVYDFYFRDGKANTKFENILFYPGKESIVASEMLLSERDNVISGQALNINYLNKSRNSIIFEAGTKFTNFSNSTNYVYEPLETIITSNALANTIYNYRESILAGYTSLSKSVGSFNIDGGLRAEQVFAEGETSIAETNIGLDYFQLYPYINTNYSLGNELNFRLSLSRKIARRLSFNDLNPALEYKNPLNIFSGNQNLQPQMTNKIYFSSIFKNKYMLSVFYDVDQDIRSVIPLLENDEYFIFRTINIERGRSIGINISAPVEIGSLWKINGNVGLYDHKVNSKEFGLLSTSFNCSAFVSNEFSVSDRSKVQFNMSYTTPMTYGFYSSEEIFTTFLSANFYLLKKQGVLSFNVNDLFGTAKLNSEELFYDMYLQQMKPLSNQRSASVKFTYRFKTGAKVKSESKNSKNFGEIRFN